MKKFLALLLALVMVLGLAACGGTPAKTDGSASTSDASSSTPAASSTSGDSSAAVKDTLTIAFSQDRGTLDPMYNIGYDMLNCLRQLYEGLWEWDSEGNQEWILCTGIDFVSDTCWKLHIREGVTFSNGNPLTASDVVFSLWRGNHRTGEADYLPNLDLDNTYAEDDYTVVMNFTQYDLSYIYSMTSLMIFDEESFDEESIAQNPIGTGQYEVTEYVVNSHISIAQREGYWGEYSKIKSMNFKLYTEDSQMTNAVVTGEVDVCTIPFQDIEYVESAGNYNVYIGKSAQAQTRALYFNTTEYGKLCGNKEARWAIAMAIDTEAMLDIAFNGYGNVSRMPCSAYCIDAKDELLDLGVYAEGYNPEKAKELAEKAGIVGETFTISTNGTSIAISCAELIQTDLNAIGVNVEINNYDTGSWLSVAFNPEAAGDMLVDFTGVPSMTVSQNVSCWYLYHLGGGFTTTTFDQKARMDEISGVIMSIADADERASMNKELVEIESDELNWFSMIDTVTAMGYAKGLEGFEIMTMGNVDYARLYWTA